jgi:hypothetical protein
VVQIADVDSSFAGTVSAGAQRLRSVSTVFVGDRDRELAGSALRRHFVHGRLSTAELEDRIELTLRARSRDDLAAAMDGLPPVWWDLPAGVHAAAWRMRRGARRMRFLVALVRIWFRVNLALLVACGIALVVGAPVAPTLGAGVAAWALVSFAFCRVWRRGAPVPWERAAHAAPRRK